MQWSAGRVFIDNNKKTVLVVCLSTEHLQMSKAKYATKIKELKSNFKYLSLIEKSPMAFKLNLLI